MSHILPQTRFFGLHFCRSQCRSYFNHWDAIGHQISQFWWNKAKPWPLNCSRSFKVTNFSISGKPICDFLCVINSNLPPILHHFQDIAVDGGGSLYLTR